jgi:hypothetical protein
MLRDGMAEDYIFHVGKIRNIKNILARTPQSKAFTQ